MMRQAILLVALLCLLHAASCTDEREPLTQIMLVVRSDISPLDSIRVQVDGMGEPLIAKATLNDDPLPRTLAIVHRGGPLGPIEIATEAVLGKAIKVSHRARLSFVRGRNVMLTVDLSSACLGVMCTRSDETCAAASCEPIAVDEDDLPDWSGDPAKPADAGSEEDAQAPEAGSGGSQSGSGGRAAGRSGGGAGGRSGSGGDVCSSCAFDADVGRPNGSLACSDTTCRLTCDTGFMNADGQLRNGCEVEAGFEWRTSNVDLEAGARSTASALVVDCDARIELASGSLGPVTICNQQVQPMLVNQRGGGPEVALFALRSLRVDTGKKLSFGGPRPVVLVVFGDAEIAGELDVSAVGVSPGAGGSLDCGAGQGGDGIIDEGQEASGGGGGGGFGTPGAAGGDSNSGTIARGGPGGTARSSTLAPLRGGCAGGAGAKGGGGAGGPPGAGGGALQLSVSGTLRVTGVLAAAGGGGRAQEQYGDAGGGGGSGGALLLEATRIELIAGSWLTANGGGGGQGGLTTNNSGADGEHASAAVAKGGTGAGTGGDGAAGVTEATAGGVPTACNSLDCGGGGGGGGVGRIVLYAEECELAGSTSPAASCAAHPL